MITKNNTTGVTGIVAGFLLMFLCGVAYSYGVVMPSIKDAFELSKAQAALPFSAILIAYTLGMWVGGIFLDRLGPTKSCVIGVILFASGFSIAGSAQGIGFLLVTYGLICGFGIGMSYIAAASNAVKWFPHRRGLAAGCVILGFGLGSLILAPLKHWLITHFGWRHTFHILGTVFFVLGTLLACLIRAPETKSTDPQATSASNELSPVEMLQTTSFRLLWTAWALCLCAGLGWMAHIPIMTQKEGVPAALAALTLSTVALANGFSRPIVGAIADKVGRLTTLLGATAIFLIICILMLLPIQGGWRFFAMGIFFGACFGTFLVNFSPIAIEFYGSRSLGSNLGLLYTSYGIGALIGPALFGAIYDRTGSYTPAIQLSIVLCAIALFLFSQVKGVRGEINKAYL